MTEELVYRKFWVPLTTYTVQWILKNKAGDLQPRAGVQSITYKFWDATTDQPELLQSGTLDPALVWFDTASASGPNFVWNVEADWFAKGNRVYRIEVLVNHDTDLQGLLIEEIRTVGALTQPEA